MSDFNDEITGDEVSALKIELMLSEINSRTRSEIAWSNSHSYGTLSWLYTQISLSKSQNMMVILSQLTYSNYAVSII